MNDDPKPPPRDDLVASEIMAQLREDRAAAQRLFVWLDEHGIRHSRIISATTMCRLVGTDRRTWHRWVSGERCAPVAAMRLICTAAGIQWPRVIRFRPKAQAPEISAPSDPLDGA